MLTARFSLFAVLTALLSIGSTAAQDRMPSKLPAEIRDSMGSGAFTPAYTTPATLPDAPKPQHVIDKKFVAVIGALGGSEAMRFTSRQLVLENELAAGAPWVTSVRSNLLTVEKDAGIFAAEFIGTYELKREHSWLPGDRIIRKFWWAYPVAMTVLHVKNGVGNIRTQGPGGCTSVECAMQMQQMQ
ncbi:MAG: hypothetical protein WBX38_09565 [Candidatus Sulfotelmatobacter sp.]